MTHENSLETYDNGASKAGFAFALMSIASALGQNVKSNNLTIPFAEAGVGGLMAGFLVMDTDRDPPLGKLMLRLGIETAALAVSSVMIAKGQIFNEPYTKDAARVLFGGAAGTLSNDLGTLCDRPRQWLKANLAAGS